MGSFFDDETKLRVQWPLSIAGRLTHDIPFGHTTSLPERPFFPTSWVDVSDGTIGLAYLHQSSPKHWVKANVLNNLFAWGEDTDAIGNRLDMGRWPKTFDQRLRGGGLFNAALYPHAGDWRAADVPAVARGFGLRPPARSLTHFGGPLPAQHTLLSLPNPNLAATAVFVDGDEVVCRAYSTGQPADASDVRLNGLRATGLYALDGAPVEQLKPYQIGHLRFAPTRAAR
jgi:hypothetical protein